MHPIESTAENLIPERDKPTTKIASKSAITCDFCDKTFKFKATLRQHEKIHYGIKQHECELCHRRFLHKSTLKCHLRLHTGEKPYKCPHCPKTFHGQTALNCHIFRHTNEGAKCPLCPKVFATSSIVKQHLKQVHTNDRPNVCNLCGMTYKHLKSLRIHLRNHQKRVCPECGVGFDSVYAMLKHRKSHIKQNLPFKCEHCDRAFEQRSKLVSHENLRGRPFQCELCCHSFNKQDFLTNHQRRIHWKQMGLERLRVAEPQNGWNRKGIPKPKRTKKSTKSAETEDPHSDHGAIDTTSDVKHVLDSKDEKANVVVSDACRPETKEECQEFAFKTDKSYSDVILKQEDLTESVHKSNEKSNYMTCVNNPSGSPKIEILKARDNTNDDFRCPLCGILCDGAVGFRRHRCDPLAEKQLSSKEFVCEMCGNLYATAATLAVHRTKQHSTVRFQCDQCHRSFAFRCILEKHIRTDHDNERMSCKLCDRVFKYTQDLKVHMQHHDDPRPFKCDQCASAFRFPSALRSHRILHQTQVPFKCDICEKQFRFENSLRVHKRLHTGVKQFKCDICDREFATKAPMLRHMKVHDSGKAMRCVVCGMVYYKKVDLEIHQSKEHPDHASVGKVKPIHSCELCGKEFTKKSNLKAHSYIHEEVYRFPCKLCNQSFKQHAGLRNHIVNNHKSTKLPATVELIDRIENVQPNA